MRSLIFIACLFLAACTAKTVEIPIPMECPKPNIPIAHDYIADLNENSKPDQFVKACLATRQSYMNAYKACTFYNQNNIANT